MKTTLLKGFVLSIIFFGLGYIASAQEGKSSTHEIKPYKVEFQRIESPTKVSANKNQQIIKQRDQRVNRIQALPVEKRATIREVAKPTK